MVERDAAVVGGLRLAAAGQGIIGVGHASCLVGLDQVMNLVLDEFLKSVYLVHMIGGF